MERPRRRSAARPAGPPNAAPPPESAAPHPHPGGHGPVEQATPGAADGPGSEPPQHRRRQRQARQNRDAEARGQSGPAAPQPDEQPAETSRTHRHPPGARDDRRRESAMERSLRALVSTRTTQLPPTVAMRAREVATPTAADLARAEEELVIVRRFYVPPAPLVGGKAAEPRGAEPRDPRARGEGRRGGRRPQRGGT